MWVGGIGFNQLAQTADLDVQAAVKRFQFTAPGQLSQSLTRQGYPGVAHQGLQHGKFTCGQGDVFVVFAQCAFAQVKLEWAEGGYAFFSGRATRQFGGGAPAQHRVNAGQQFAWVEGFGQVVVSAQFQPDDAVGFVAFGCQHDDGCAFPRRTQAFADRQTVFPRHHQVKNDQVNALSLHDAGHGGTAIGHDGHKPLLCEVAAQQVADALIVINNQNLVGASRQRGWGGHVSGWGGGPSERVVKQSVATAFWPRTGCGSPPRECGTRRVTHPLTFTGQSFDHTRPPDG